MMKSLRGVLKSRIRHIKKVPTVYLSVFIKPDVLKELNRLHEDFVFVTASKVCSQIISLLQLYLKGTWS